MTTTKSVLFVCWGNVCRSPAAEMMLKRELQRQGIDNIRIESAGVGADADSRKPSLGMWWATLRRGFWLKPNPRMFRKLDCSRYDLIVALDREVHLAIKSIASHSPSNVKLMSDFLPDGALIDVPDPMDRKQHICNLALDMIAAGCRTIAVQMAMEPTNVGRPITQPIIGGSGTQMLFNWLDKSTVCEAS